MTAPMVQCVVGAILRDIVLFLGVKERHNQSFILTNKLTQCDLYSHIYIAKLQAKCCHHHLLAFKLTVNTVTLVTHFFLLLGFLSSCFQSTNI